MKKLFFQFLWKNLSGIRTTFLQIHGSIQTSISEPRLLFLCVYLLILVLLNQLQYGLSGTLRNTEVDINFVQQKRAQSGVD